MKEIKVRAGYYLADPNKEHFFKAVSGANINEDDYIEVAEDEAEEIMQRRDAESKITSIEVIDEISAVADVIPNVINTFSLDDKEALKRKDLYPDWSEYIGQSLTAGFKVKYIGKLYRVRQGISVVLADQYPSELTAALYEEINETASGTADDPIPYTGNMELFEGKYYSQNGVTYKCIRSTGQPVYHDLSALVGLYVEIA